MKPACACWAWERVEDMGGVSFEYFRVGTTEIWDRKQTSCPVCGKVAELDKLFLASAAQSKSN
jgi:hypothetical protein